MYRLTKIPLKFGFSLFSVIICGCLSSILSCTSSIDKAIEDAPMISVTVIDDSGAQINLPSIPTRVLSLAPNITEMIYAIGGESKLTGVSQACNYPAEAQTKNTVIQTFPETDLEAIISLNPDLILVTDELFSPEIIQKLKQSGIPVYIQKYQKLSDITRNIRVLGKLLQNENKAVMLADSLDEICSTIMEKTQYEIKYPVAFLINDEPIMIAGKKSFIQEMIKLAGGKNIGTSLDRSYPEVSPEFLIRENPEFILVPGDNVQAFSRLVSRFPGLFYLRASEQKHIIEVEADLFLRPGPRTFIGLIKLTKILHAGISLPYEI